MTSHWHEFIYDQFEIKIMKIDNKIPWGLATGTLGITIVGMFGGTAILGIASIIGGTCALVTALSARQ